jgi:hypothetical protein
VTITNGRGAGVEAVCGLGLDESVTERFTLDVPELLVVPVIKPVEMSNEKLRGSPVMFHVKGAVPPEIWGWKLYATFGAPAGRDVVVMVRTLVPTVNPQEADITPFASFT